MRSRKSKASRTVRRWGNWLTCGLVIVLCVACSGSNDDPAATATVAPTGALAPSPAPSPVASPSPLPDFAATPGVFTSPQADVGQVVWSTAIDPATKAPTGRVTELTANVTTIYAALPVYRVKPGTVFTANWTYNNTPVEPLTSHVTASAGYDDGWIEFHITRSADDQWPTGTYQVTVMVGAQQAESASVQVRDGQ